MGEAELARLAELTKTDAEFRKRYRENPREAAESTEIPLTEEDLASLLPNYPPGADPTVDEEWGD